MKQFFDKHITKLGEKEALGYIHDKIEEAKFHMLNGMSEADYVPKLEEAYEMLGDYITRKVSPETSLSAPEAGRGHSAVIHPPHGGRGMYYPNYYGMRGPYHK